MSAYQRKRGIHLHVMVTEDELNTIHQRMAEAGITNTGAYIRKMALNGYVLNVDLSPVRELVSLQRRCVANLNQVAIHANTYGVYPTEIAALQKGYAELWGRVSDVLKQLVRQWWSYNGGERRQIASAPRSLLCQRHRTELARCRIIGQSKNKNVLNYLHIVRKII